VGPRAESGQAENLVPTGIRSPDRPARSSVAIPTELPGPHTHLYIERDRERGRDRETGQSHRTVRFFIHITTLFTH